LAVGILLLLLPADVELLEFRASSLLIASTADDCKMCGIKNKASDIIIIIIGIVVLIGVNNEGRKLFLNVMIIDKVLSRLTFTIFYLTSLIRFDKFKCKLLV
jgi:hypothetical protein